MRKAVFVAMRMFVIVTGIALISLVLNLGFGIEAAWYWWFPLGVGFGIAYAGWNMKWSDLAD